MSKKLMRKKLAMMLANLKKKRKFFCEVEYLETTGQQTNSADTTNASWIDTGIIPNNNTKIECRMQFTTLISGQSNEALNGTTGSESAPRFAWGFASLSPYTNFYFGLGGQNLATSVTRDTNVHTFVLDAKNKTCSIDDTTQSFTSSGSLNSPRSIYLFARHTTAEYANKPCNAKIYRYRNWDNDQLVQDFIPVLDWDMTPCMYDKVSGQLFYNQGTGDFLYGRQIHEVEYLESTGTQYIDTGINPTDSTSWEANILCLPKENIRYLSLIGYGYSTIGVQSVGVVDKKWAQTSISIDYSSPTNVIANKSGQYFNGVLGNTNDIGKGILYIFNRTYTINQYPWYGKIYFAKISVNNVLVRDYIPAIDENGIGFMFDRVSHTIYDNAGSGVFSYPAREVEYIESSGTQYIDTGHAFTDDYSWEIDFDGIQDNTTIFGGRTSSYRTALLYQRVEGVYTTTCPIAGLNGSATPFQLADLRTGRHKVKMSVAQNKGSVWVDDVQVYDNTSFSGTYISGTTQALFADNFGTSVSEYSSSKVYNLKMWQSDVLVRDFIPCYKDGVLGIWDKVNDVFYDNDGTNTFTGGKIVEPEYE